MDAKVALEGVGKTFGGVRVVKGISFTIREGEFLTLLGPSGCGKSTTLRMIAGLEQNDSGVIRIDGKTVSDASTGDFVPANERNLGMVFQSYAIWPHMTVFENVAFPLRLRGMKPGDIQRKVREALRLVGMQDFESRSATKLSGGQQQRVALARAIVAEPSLVLLDEPLSNLDAKLREQMREELRRLQKQLGMTVLYVTHDQLEAITMSDRIIVMNEGDIVQQGAPRDIYEIPVNRFVADFIGSANILSGRVASRDGDLLVIDVPGMGRVTAKTAHARLAAGTETLLCLRPERVKIVPLDGSNDSANGVVNGSAAAGTNLVEGVVAEATYMGGTWEYNVRVGDNLVRVLDFSSQGHGVGEKVHLRFGAWDCTAFPE